jgi:hypothetical protein
MAKTVTVLMNIEKASVWVLMTDLVEKHEAEFKRNVLVRLQYVRFLKFGHTHLRVICEQYPYEVVEKVVEEVLLELEV